MLSFRVRMPLLKSNFIYVYTPFFPRAVKRKESTFIFGKNVIFLSCGAHRRALRYVRLTHTCHTCRQNRDNKIRAYASHQMVNNWIFPAIKWKKVFPHYVDFCVTIYRIVHSFALTCGHSITQSDVFEANNMLTAALISVDCTKAQLMIELSKVRWINVIRDSCIFASFHWISVDDFFKCN